MEIWQPGEPSGSGEGYPPSGLRLYTDDFDWDIDEDDPQTHSPKEAVFSVPTVSLEPGTYQIRAWVKRVETSDENEWAYSHQPCTVKIALSGLAYWAQLDPGFDCPNVSCAGLKKETDGCENELEIKCEYVDGNCCYRYLYNGSEVGRCVWQGGVNQFWYHKTVDGKRFLGTKHVSCNDKKGVDCEGEGCEGYWCWREVSFDCLTGVPPTVTWRRDPDLSYCPCEYPGWPGPSCGEPCPGEDGTHWCWPN